MGAQGTEDGGRPGGSLDIRRRSGPDVAPQGAGRTLTQTWSSTLQANAWPGHRLLPLGRLEDASVSLRGWNFCEPERPLRYRRGPAPAGAGTSGHPRAEHAGTADVRLGTARAQHGWETQCRGGGGWRQAPETRPDRGQVVPAPGGSWGPSVSIWAGTKRGWWEWGVWGAFGGSLAGSRTRAPPPFLPQLRGCGPGRSTWLTCSCGSGAERDTSVDKV